MIEVEPAEFVTVRVTTHVPLLPGNVCAGFGAFEFAELSPKSQNQFVIGHPFGTVELSVNVTSRRGFPIVQLKLAEGAVQTKGVGVGVGEGVGVGVAPGDGVGVGGPGVGVGVGVGVGAATGTVTDRENVRLPPWLVTSSVTVYVPGLAYVWSVGIVPPGADDKSPKSQLYPEMVQRPESG